MSFSHGDRKRILFAALLAGLTVAALLWALAGCYNPPRPAGPTYYATNAPVHVLPVPIPAPED